MFTPIGNGLGLAPPYWANLPAGLWQSASMSADGSKIYVPTFPDSILGSPPGYVHSSSDGGLTWTKQTGAGNRLWVLGCCSSDGTIVYMPDQGSITGLIYKSTDSGVTWNATNFPSLAWQQVVCSSDGTKVGACIGSQSAAADIYTSIDGGSTIVDQTTSLPRNYLAIAMPGDGTKIVTSNWLGQGPNGDGKIYVSTNWQSGSPTWTSNLGAANGATFSQALAWSRDGSTIYCAFNANGNTSHLFKSSNNGATWTDINPPTPSGGVTSDTRSWYWVACSANGQKVTATTTTYSYISSDGGSTWTSYVNAPGNPSNHQNTFFAVSDDGNTIAAAVYAGFISVSLNGGNSWRITSATP